MVKPLVILMTLLITSCSQIFFWPDRYLYSLPDKKQFTYKDIFFSSTDGNKLHSWHIKKKNTKKNKTLTLFFHGNAQNLSAHHLNFNWLVLKGHDLLIFDYRGYGLSKGQSNFQGTYKDAQAAMNLALKIFKEQKYEKLIFYGQSLGGLILSRAFADFKDQKEVDLLVLDSTFADPQGLAREKLKIVPLTRYINYIGNALISNEYASIYVLDKIKVPTLVVHGTKDKIIPINHGKTIYEKIETKKWFWKIDGGDHTDIFHGKNHYKKYRKKYQSFIEKI